MTLPAKMACVRIGKQTNSTSDFEADSSENNDLYDGNEEATSDSDGSGSFIGFTRDYLHEYVLDTIPL